MISGLLEVETSSTSEVMKLLHKGNTQRTSEPTAVNETSSRSHAVLKVSQESGSGLLSNDASASIYRLRWSSEVGCWTLGRRSGLVFCSWWTWLALSAPPSLRLVIHRLCFQSTQC